MGKGSFDEPGFLMDAYQLAHLGIFKETVKFLKCFTNIPPNGLVPYSFFVESEFNADEAIRLRDEFSNQLDEKYGLDELKKAK